MRSANRILDVISICGTLYLHLPKAKCPLRYSVDSQTSISMSGVRSGISDRNITTLANKDDRLTTKEFYELCLNQKIAIREMGGRSF